MSRWLLKTQSPFWDLNMSESMTIFKGFFKLVASCKKMGQAVDLTKGLFLDSPGAYCTQVQIKKYRIKSTTTKSIWVFKSSKTMVSFYHCKIHLRYVHTPPSRMPKCRLLRGENRLQVQPNALHLAGIITPCGSRCHWYCAEDPKRMITVNVYFLALHVVTVPPCDLSFSSSWWIEAHVGFSNGAKWILLSR